MPINAPSPQHIFLFHSMTHVIEMVNEAGLEILTEEYITANQIPPEVAEAKKLPINAALIVRKNRREAQRGQ